VYASVCVVGYNGMPTVYTVSILYTTVQPYYRHIINGSKKAILENYKSEM
jgi:hypothetical protein